MTGTNGSNNIAVFAGSLLPGAIELARILTQNGFEVKTANAASTHEALCEAGVQHSESDSASVPTLLGQSGPSAQLIIAGLGDHSIGFVDIGTHALVRAAAAQYARVIVLVESSDLATVSHQLTKGSWHPSTAQRRALAAKAFQATAALDARIAAELTKETDSGVAHKGSGDQAQVKVLVLGSGGREHCLAWKLAASPSVEHVYVAPGNGGTATAGPDISNVDIGVKDGPALVDFAKKQGISLVVVGPEDPLVAGISDTLKEAGIPCFGPSAAAAKLEASKAFSKDFMARHDIRTAVYRNFNDQQHKEARAYVEQLSRRVVVKASGLAAGKGVLIPTTMEETLQAIDQVLLHKEFGDAGNEVVVEEFLEGEEISILALCDGKTSICMPGAQDHKRALDGDQGLNTGGMGAYAPAPCLTPALRRQCQNIVQRTVTAMAKEGSPFVGVLFAGFMLTKDGPVVLEYNVRMGDPETQVVLPLLKSDLYPILLACVEGRLEGTPVNFKDAAAATVVMAAKGYPEKYPKGMPISGVQQANRTEGVTVFQAGTKKEGEQIVASGGRVLSVTGVGADFREALAKAYSGVEQIKFDPSHFRSDIGHRALNAPLKIGVLGSGRGTDMQPIIEAIRDKGLNAEIVAVVSNLSKAYILERAANNGLPHKALSAKNKSRDDFDEEVSQVLSEAGVELVLLIGYMRILSPKFCKRWADRCLNVHPSLLPDFAGGMDLEVHKAVLAAGKKTTGCTVHFVTEAVDGGPIVVQEEVPVEAGDTPESLKAKVQAKEGTAFLSAIDKFMRGEIGPAAARRENSKKAGGAAVSYKDAGVDIDAGNALVERIKPACKSTRRPGCDADLGGFGGLFSLAAAGFDAKETILIGATDGVGTKLKVAQIMGNHSGVGVDLVAMCVNDLIVAGGEPLFFLDYYATGKLAVEEAALVVEGIAEGCRQANCGLIGGETAEMPSMYREGEYDVAGFAVGAVRQGEVLPVQLTPGDVVLGLRSSGVHSNGFSLVRRIVELEGIQYQDPAPFNPSVSLGDALLVPTRIYVRSMMPLLKRKLVKAMAHITGGGLTENIPRVLSPDIAAVINVQKSGWTLPPVFKWLQQAGRLNQEEILRTLNCGIGMVVVVSQEHAEEARAVLLEQGEDVLVLGSIEQRESESSPQVVVNGQLQ